MLILGMGLKKKIQAYSTESPLCFERPNRIRHFLFSTLFSPLEAVQTSVAKGVPESDT